MGFLEKSVNGVDTLAFIVYSVYMNERNTATTEERAMGAMRTVKQTIGLRHLIRSHAVEVRSMAADAPCPLDPDHVDWLPVVRPAGDALALVDGFSRIAGMVAFGAGEFDVIVVEGADDLCAEIDCDSVIGDCAELDAIYADFTPGR